MEVLYRLSYLGARGRVARSGAAEGLVWIDVLAEANHPAVLDVEDVAEAVGGLADALQRAARPADAMIRSPPSTSSSTCTSKPSAASCPLDEPPSRGASLALGECLAWRTANRIMDRERVSA
jgi:hypothetical protein